MLTAFLKLTLYFRTASLIFHPVRLMPCEISYKVRNYDYRCMSSIMLNHIIFSEVRNNLQDMETRLTLNSMFTHMKKWFEKKVGAHFCFIPLWSHPCWGCLISMYQCNPTKQCLDIRLLRFSTRLSENTWKTSINLQWLWGQPLWLQLTCSSPWPFPHLSAFC